MRLIVCSAISLCAAPAAFGQIDSTTLRAKYGPPLHRETFTVRPGVEMTVTYAESSNAVCRLEIPAGVATENEENAILGEVVPDAVRGKEIFRGLNAMGRASESLTQYEHATVSRLLIGGNTKPAITVIFKDSGCQNASVPRF